jgi:hypothetical protein
LSFLIALASRLFEANILSVSPLCESTITAMYWISGLFISLMSGPVIKDPSAT